MASIRLENIEKSYGSVRAVDGVSFECRDKEFLVILGPSGAGKTSILKMVAGLEKVTGGEIFFDGVPVNPVPPEKRNVAMVFETYALYPHMSVRENLLSPLRGRIGREEALERITGIAGQLEIGHLLNRKPAELSGGQKQRVSLGRALARRADILLMDEPISHLDAKLRHNMRRELKKFRELFNTTVIYVTHDYLEALSLADRILILNNGRIHQTGTPARIYKQPADTFVASLLGHPRINLITLADLGKSADLQTLATPDGALSLKVPAKRLRGMGDKRRVTAGIRPLHIGLSVPGKDDRHPAEVYVCENMETRSLVEVKTGDQELRVISDRKDYRIGDKVRPDIPVEHMIFFDPDTGRNLEIQNPEENQHE